MAEPFVILDDGETLITGEWMPPPEVLAERMVTLANKMDNMFAPLVAARQVMIDSTEYRFESETAPDGTPWTGLDPDYLADKVSAGYPADEILVRTGEGKKAATSESAWFIGEDSLWFVPAAMPHYMDLHQQGTSTNSAEGISVLRKLRAGQTITTKEAGVVLEDSGGRGRNLPQRQFIGLSVYDLEDIESIFNKWFGDNIIEEFPTGGQTGFNMLGEFPVIGTTSRGQPILSTPSGPRFGRMG